MIISKRALIENLKNIPGWRTSRRLVVLESDDWGSNRIWNQQTLEELQRLGVLMQLSGTARLDTLATKEDLNLLSSTLARHIDKQGNPANMTMFANPANPDFKEIQRRNFSDYVPQGLDQLLEEKYPGQGVLEFWKSQIKAGTISIAYHGREHVNVPLWMRYLEEQDPIAMACFKVNFCALPAKDYHPLLKGLRAAYYFDDLSAKDYLAAHLNEGLKMLKQIFDVEIATWCPPNNINHPDFNEQLTKDGIKGIVSKNVNLYSDGQGGFFKEPCRSGKRNKSGQVHYTRNCSFEPINSAFRLDATLAQVEAAFRWKKPAIITTHAVNYSGGIDEQMRNRNITELNKLLGAILKRWPEVEFVSSDVMVNALSA